MSYECKIYGHLWECSVESVFPSILFTCSRCSEVLPKPGELSKKLAESTRKTLKQMERNKYCLMEAFNLKPR